MSGRYRPSVEIRNECPYCGFKFSIDARDITGELHALRCLDCQEKFVVEILVEVTHKIDGLAGIAPDAILDRLSGVDEEKPAQDDNAEEPDPGIAGGSSALEFIADAIETNDRTCIGCGCKDSAACVDEISGDACHWLRIDDDAGVGVCSECEGHVARFDAGFRVPESEKDDGVPTLTDEVATESGSVQPEGDSPQLTEAEIEELSELLQIIDDEEAEEAESIDFESVEAFACCQGCPTPDFCQDRATCSREEPAAVHSANVRAKPRKPPPPMTASSIVGPGRDLGPGLRYRDRR